MKVINKILFAAIIIPTAIISGCGAKVDEEISEHISTGKDIIMSVEENSYNVARNQLEWIELDQLDYYEDIRDSWDDTLNIIRFDLNSKNGCIYVETDGNWSGNSVLYNAFQNKVFINEYWSQAATRSELSKEAINVFSDIENEAVGITAAVNTYYNILPTNEDGTSGMFNYITRAEAMAGICRGDTPVILVEENTEFNGVVGESSYNTYAQLIDSEQGGYLNTKDGSLTKEVYHQTITRGEGIYLLMNRYYRDQMDAVDLKSKSEMTDCTGVIKELELGEIQGKRKYELEYSLQNADKETGAGKVPEEIYRALVVAYNNGIVSSDTRWSDGMLAGELINLMIKVYDTIYGENSFLVNQKAGENAGQSLIFSESEEEEKGEEIAFVIDSSVQSVKDITDIDKLIKTYGEEINMTEEEIAEAKEIGGKYTIIAVDKYMIVDNCTYLNVRIGPGTEYRIIKSVPKGTEAHIVGVVQENGWYRVIADGKISYQSGVYFSEKPE